MNSPIFRLPLLLLAFLLTYQVSLGQQTIYDETTLLYKKEINGGINIHTEGLGLFFTKSTQKTVSKLNRWNIEIVTMKHSKERKNFHRSFDNTKGYFFGKKNSLLLIRPTYGRKTIIAEKYRKDGVSFSTHFAIGPSIGILKPTYILYGYRFDNSPSGTYDVIQEERFDIIKHSNISDIVGRASYFKGFYESTAIVGLHAKFGLDVEYSPYQTGIKGIETGIALDVFSKPVEIMDFRVLENNSFFLTFYINMYVGKKYNTLK